MTSLASTPVHPAVSRLHGVRPMLEDGAIFLLYVLLCAVDAVLWFFGKPPLKLNGECDVYDDYSSLSWAAPVQKEGYLANLAPIECVAWLMLPLSVGAGWANDAPSWWGWPFTASLIVLVAGGILHNKLEA